MSRSRSPQKRAAPPLLTRADLRLALTASLSGGLALTLGLADAFYAPLAVGAALGGTLGASRVLGIERLQGTVLGALIVLVSVPTLSGAVSLPLGVAFTLFLTRLLGGALGLHSGYKVAGLVVAMGWTVHAGSLVTWLPERLLATLVGVLMAWLAVGAFWPSRALELRSQLSRRLFHAFAAALRERAELLNLQQEISGAERVAQRQSLMGMIVELQNQRADALVEVGNDWLGDRLGRLWDLEDQLLSGLLSHLRTLLRLPHVPMAGPSLQRLLGAEVAALETVAGRLELWADRWPQRPGLRRPHGGSEPLDPVRAELEAAEQQVFADPEANRLLMAGAGGRRAVACQQLIATLQSFETAWSLTP
ncbi:MAG: FUSC family protein [Synechococcaceae cyanobacterium]|nr:FUSC family protein [Synechococcaceae cyanobacterium]